MEENTKIQIIDLEKFNKIIKEFNNTDNIDKRDLLIADILALQAQTIFKFNDEKIINGFLSQIPNIYSPRELERIYQEGQDKLQDMLESIERQPNTNYYLGIKFWLDNLGQRHYDFMLNQEDFSKEIEEIFNKDTLNEFNKYLDKLEDYLSDLDNKEENEENEE